MRTGIQWKRVAAEGLVIVTSILLAFAVQAWWETRQERREEAEYLEALRGELDEASAQVSALLETLEGTRARHARLVAQFPGDDLAPADSLIVWLSGLSFPVQFNPPMAVLDDLMSSGGIRLIRDDEVRLSIARYVQLLQLHESRAAQAWQVWTDRIQPFLEGRVSRVDRLLQGTYPRPVPFDPAPFDPAYEEIFSEPAFQDMIAERWIRLDATTTGLTDIRLLVEDLQARIN